jgi:hypothetical protein
MKPKPLSSLNHLTVPCAISLTFGQSGAGDLPSATLKTSLLRLMSSGNRRPRSLR